jgi:hypothetical protein
VLSSHHLRVWLDIAYSIGGKYYYYPDAVYLHRWGGGALRWCLDSPCSGSITGSLVWPLSLGAILSTDVCVEVVHRLYVWYYPVVCRVHLGCQGASCCVMFSRFLCVRLVSIYETLWWPMYGWCTGVLFGGFKFVFCLELISCTITFHCSLSACTVYGHYW